VNQKKYALFASLILSLSIFILYSYNLSQAVLFTSDLGRDLYKTIRITQGDLVLIGSKMNLGGYFAGPYLYYLLAPSLLIGRFDINAVLYFHAMLFAASIGYFFWQTSQKLNPLKALVGALALTFMPLLLICARYPSNGYSYLSLLLFLLTYIFFSNFESKKALLILGLVTGVILNIHPISSLALIFVAFYILFSLKKKQLFLFFAGALLVTFAPTIVFELRHDFVMTKDTFINHSYLTFTKDSHTPQFWQSKNPILSSFLFISEKFKKLIVLPPLFYFISVFCLLVWKRLHSRKIPKLDLFLALSMIASLFLLIAVLRFHFEEHYIFSVAFFISVTAMILILRSKLWIFILVIIFLEIQNFPVYLYQNSARSLIKIEQAVKYSINQRLVSKTVPFNLIQITDAYGLVPTGFEYRFFFRKYGLYPNSEYDFENAKVLLIFSETPYYNIDRFKMWATEQFGREYFNKREVYHSGNIDIYRISKQ